VCTLRQNFADHQLEATVRMRAAEYHIGR